MTLALRQCGATTRRGRQCLNPPAGHTSLCHTHALPGRALTASVSAVDMEATGWKEWKAGAREWQREAWRLYDITGPLRFVANWVGSSVSRCVMYVAKVDESGEPGDRATKKEIAALAAGPLGTGPAKDENLRLLAICNFVAGEAWTVAEAGAEGSDDGKTDRWFVVSSRQIKRSGDTITIRRPRLQGGGDMTFRPGEDILLQVWTPHPDNTDEPDSPARSALPVLRAIEVIWKRIFAELDSRLTGAGLLVLSQNMDFPRGDDTPAGVEGFSQLLMRTMATSMQDRSSAAAVAPIVMTAPPDQIDKLKHLTFWTDLSAQLLPMLEAAVRYLAQSLDIPAEILTGMAGASHWCTLPDVEIMTMRGWRTHDQLEAGEPVLTLNHETGLAEWQPLRAVNTWDVIDEPMVDIRGGRHHSVTTLGHRWPTLTGAANRRGPSWDTSAGLYAKAVAAGENAQNHDYLILAAHNADLPTEPKYEDALTELVAWYSTEGSEGVREGRRTPKVVIHQSHIVNPDNCARIRRALTTLFGPESDRLDKGGRYASPESVRRSAEARRLRAEYPTMSCREISKRVGVSDASYYLKQDPKTRDPIPRWRVRTSAGSGGGMTHFVLNASAAEVILEHAPGRVVTTEFVLSLTAAQLELFIDTSVRGDGSYMGTGRTIVFGQKDPRMCDALEVALILSGRSVRRSLHVGYGLSKDGVRQKTQHMVTGGSRATLAPRGRAFTRTAYTGQVWCPTTDNGTWLARYDGTVFYTGNSSWQIEESTVKTQIVPILNRIADAFTTGYLRPALEELGEDPDAYCYAFDTGPLTARPDRSDDALSYQQAGIITTDAAIELGALREDQKLEGEERLKWLAEKLVLANPQLVTDPVLRELVGFPPAPEAAQPPPAAAPSERAAEEPVEAEKPETSPPERPTVEDEQEPEQEGPPPQRARKEPSPGRKAKATTAAKPAVTAAGTPGQAPPDDNAALVPVAALATVRALSLAGSRLIPHTQRDRWPGTPRHQLHTRAGPVDPARAEKTLRGAWDDLPAVAAELAVDPGRLRDVLHQHTVGLLTSGRGYDPDQLREEVVFHLPGRHRQADHNPHDKGRAAHVREGLHGEPAIRTTFEFDDEDDA